MTRLTSSVLPASSDSRLVQEAERGWGQEASAAAAAAIQILYNLSKRVWIRGTTERGRVFWEGEKRKCWRFVEGKWI